ncbi:hypothetical protein GoPhGRU1p79 [Gordonia phage GRU1]|uniref:Uncharacterized protein n=1 Tax=Gordonia phage GRU1 TaxID=1109710 RepID=G8EK38_9CAUD|nr:hypothetical protein GoPhGRU1p79 [Gordonia phage GRU1]AET09920.1 hypothetical protein [Gordonia phage GRU1]
MEDNATPAATRRPMARHRRATHAYRDTLIGPRQLPITRGYTGRYRWSVRTDGDAVLVSAHVAGTDRRVPVADLPNYVAAAILEAIATDI